MISLRPVPKASGIYLITCLANDRRYVGQSVDLQRRFQMHSCALRGAYHVNPVLQRAYNKHGVYEFIFEVIALCPPEQLNEVEAFYIENLDTAGNTGFNLQAPDTEGVVRASLESRSRMRAARLGKKHSDLTRMRIGEANRRRSHSEDTKRLIGKSSSNRRHSEQALRKMRLASGAQLLTILDETKPVSEWAAQYGLSYNTVNYRLKNGWAPERALTEPSRKTRKPTSEDNQRRHSS